MEKIVLSLKNLYMVLMTDDFPVYSESVIGRNERRGQTMHRFWQAMIAEEFRDQPCGKIIWRHDSKTNRYLSYVCNRNPAMKTYAQYARELASAVSATALMNQIARFEDFLTAKKYRADILLRRVRELLRLIETDDPCVTPGIVEQLRTALEFPLQEQEGTAEKLFRSAYLMTLLTIYAAAGEAMADPSLAVLRREEYSMVSLWQERDRQRGRKHTVEFLTAHCGILQDNPLPRNHFFGREEALFDLREIAVSGRKCILSGIGGIGKTELLRQLLCLCTGEKVVDLIAVVPYETGIAESFSRAFLNLTRGDPEQAYHQALYRIRQAAQEGQQVLILIDNLDGQDDPALRELLDLPCSVLITTRRTCLDGFEVYPVQPLSRATGALIFRDNYGSPLNREDQALLNILLENQSLRHPLTLQLLARAASSKRWKLTQLREYLLSKNTALTWTEEERTIRLNQLYSQLYSLSRVPRDCQPMMELFTLLPRDSYSPKFLTECFPELLGGQAEGKLRALAEGGWLEETGSGYAMHPLIAQCLRRKVITEAKLQPVLACLHRQLPEGGLFDSSVCHSEVCRRSADILIYISEFLTGSISKTLMLDIITAMGVGIFSQEIIERHAKALAQLFRRCAEHDDLVEIRYRTVINHWFFVDTPKIRELYAQQKAALTVSRQDFISFCLSAAPSIVYEDPAFAAELMSHALTAEVRPDQYALACYHMSGKCYHEGNTAGALQWSQTGTEYARAHPECGEDMLVSNMATLCMQYLRLGRCGEAEPLLRELGSRLDDRSIPMQRMRYLDLMALYCKNTGRLEESLEFYLKSLAMIREYRGEDVNYHCTHVGIGTICRQLKQYDRAMEHYRTALDYFRKDGDAYYAQVVLTNMATAYLEQGMAREALACLDECIEDARKLEGMAHGEPCLAMAKAWRLLGDRKKEQTFLQEALPHLVSAYGEDHPKAAETRQRLAELETQTE
ncbi:MAG: ATP-binding protein [Oscillospiraceae bacterium]|nr:ATP-binding protein [Oscillospiraceae bacterium]